MIPSKASLIDNERGTAMGMWFNTPSCQFISMPGVPHEMRHMLDKFVLPRLIEKHKLPKIIYKYLMTSGIGESSIYEKIEDLEANFPHDVHLAYLPNLGNVKLRLSTIVNDENETAAAKELENIREQINMRIAKHVFSYDPDETLGEVIGQILINKNKSISTAESCTGGYISHLLTSVPGSSAYFEGAIVAYSYDFKENLLQVNHETLNTVGAVSEETVLEMLTGLLDRTGTDYGIAVSGIAGPGGGTPDKPVGTVWIAVGSNDKMTARCFQLTTQRDYNIKISAHIALNMLRNFILDNES